jgi:hypothetical protein
MRPTLCGPLRLNQEHKIAIQYLDFIIFYSKFQAKVAHVHPDEAQIRRQLARGASPNIYQINQYIKWQDKENGIILIPNVENSEYMRSLIHAEIIAGWRRDEAW